MDATLQIVLQFGALGLLALVLYFLGRALANAGAAFLRDLVEQLRLVVAELKAMRIEDAERHAELQACIERSAKETRHSIANAVQRLATREDDDTPAFGRRTRRDTE